MWALVYHVRGGERTSNSGCQARRWVYRVYGCQWLSSLPRGFWGTKLWLSGCVASAFLSWGSPRLGLLSNRTVKIMGILRDELKIEFCITRQIYSLGGNHTGMLLKSHVWMQAGKRTSDGWSYWQPENLEEHPGSQWNCQDAGFSAPSLKPWIQTSPPWLTSFCWVLRSQNAEVTNKLCPTFAQELREIKWVFTLSSEGEFLVHTVLRRSIPPGSFASSWFSFVSSFLSSLLLGILSRPWCTHNACLSFTNPATHLEG